MKICEKCGYPNEENVEVCADCSNRLGSGANSAETRVQEPDVGALEPGTSIAGRYRIESELGRGAMGIVYRVRDTQMNDRTMALKVIHPYLTDSSKARERFIEEVSLCLDLLHPHIVRVHMLETWQSVQFFTMEYIAGRNLREWMHLRKDNSPRFTLSETLSVILPLLDALSYAHDHTIHRDIKPENIMVQGQFPKVSIKVLDFGIAKTMSPSRFTRTSQMLGTPYYLAPEQMTHASDIDHRADLYSVGMILYEMLTGEIPHIFPKKPSEVHPEVPSAVDAVVFRLLEKSPRNRYRTAADAGKALQQAAGKKDRQQAATRRESETRSLLKKTRQAMQEKRQQEVDRGKSLLNVRRWGQAERVFLECLREDPDNPELKRLLKEAADKMRHLRQLEQEAGKCEKEGDLDRAVDLLNQAMSCSPDADTFRQKIMVLKARSQNRGEADKPNKVETDGAVSLASGLAELPLVGYGLLMGMSFVWIKIGSFLMGSPASEAERCIDETQHKVTISKGFYLQTTQVTVGQWRDFVEDTGYRGEAERKEALGILTRIWRKKVTYWDNPGFTQTDKHPVTCVSWNDTQEFIAWLNRKEGECYRLPTEAEWEYACRAGTTTPFSFGKCLSTSQANYDGNFPYPGCPKGEYRVKTVQAGSLTASAWGLSDMHGNVYEWCHDWYSTYPFGNVVDPKGPSSGTSRVLRGGGWGSYAWYCRSANRYFASSDFRGSNIGFRLARDL